MSPSTRGLNDPSKLTTLFLVSMACAEVPEDTPASDPECAFYAVGSLRNQMELKKET